MTPAHLARALELAPRFATTFPENEGPTTSGDVIEVLAETVMAQDCKLSLQAAKIKLLEARKP